jgi:hypothetical protein
LGDSTSEVARWAMVGAGTNFALHLLVSLAWIGLVVGVVWKHRRDAAGTLLLAVILSAVLTCVAPALTSAVGFYASRNDGTASFVRTNAVLQIAMAVIALVPQALLMAGVAQLARPKGRDVRDPDVRSLDP